MEAAAVVGEVFDRSAVRALVSDESAGRIEDHLGRLLLKDVLRPVPSGSSVELTGSGSAISCSGMPPTM